MNKPNFSFVLETPAVDAETAQQHFAAKLTVETDAWDVKTDMERGQESFIVVDTRSREDYERQHIAGAINLPHRSINEDTTAQLSKDKVLITYCWSPGCNASTRGALRLAALGFRVKELIGGLEYWIKEGGPVEGTFEHEEVALSAK